MDKKNTAIGILLFAAAFGLFWWNNQEQSKLAEQRRALAAEQAKQAPAPAATTTSAKASSTPAPQAEAPAAPERLLTLENDTLRVSLTTHGGAIKSAALLKHAAALGKDAAKDPVIFNEHGGTPALALTFPDPTTGKATPWTPDFRVKASTAQQVVFEATRHDGVTVTRTYAFAAPEKAGDKVDPHRLRVTTAFTRTGGDSAPVTTGITLGTLPPSESDSHNQFLNISAFDGENYEKVGVDKFTESSGFLGFGAHPAMPEVIQPRTAEAPHWFATSNHFFTGIATLDKDARDFATGLVAHPVKIPAVGEHAEALTVGAVAGLNLGTIAPGQTKTVALDYFIGPKEYARLSALGDHQDKVVQFSKVFGLLSIEWLCKILMTSLTGLHWLIDSTTGLAWAWGLAIVTLTCLIKAATWPLTGMQMKAAENMKKLQKPMEALKEKYKDNPQKMQQETMKLYAEHRVNPFAGCLPIFIQIPVFFGLYTAFQTCAELRHQPFLWFSDLAIPDTIPGIPYLHVLPLLMGVTMLINMRMTPMTTTDPNQKMIFYGMMILFPVMCYSMPAGLTTYYTVNNLLTVLQSWILKRKREAREAAEATGTVEVIPPAKTKSGKTKK